MKTMTSPNAKDLAEKIHQIYWPGDNPELKSPEDLQIESLLAEALNEMRLHTADHLGEYYRPKIKEARAEGYKEGLKAPRPNSFVERVVREDALEEAAKVAESVVDVCSEPQTQKVIAKLIRGLMPSNA